MMDASFLLLAILILCAFVCFGIAEMCEIQNDIYRKEENEARD
jgi:hypothetical protein